LPLHQQSQDGGCVEDFPLSSPLVVSAAFVYRRSSTEKVGISSSMVFVAFGKSSN